MSKSNPYQKIKQEDFLRYLNGEMSDRERNAFERAVQKDLFAADALEGLTMLGSEQLENDLDRLNSRLKKRTTGSRKMIWVRVAASVAVLLTIGTLYFTVFTDKLDFQGRGIAETEKAESTMDKGVSEEFTATGRALETAEGDGVETGGSGETPEEEISPAVSRAEYPSERLDEFDDTEQKVAEVNQDESEISTEPVMETAAGLEITEDPNNEVYEASLALETALEEQAGESVIPVEEDLVIAEESVEFESEVAPAVTEQSNITQAAALEEMTLSDSRAMAKSSKRESPASALDDVSSTNIINGDTIAAVPQGGRESFDEYIAQNLNYPEADISIIQGMVILQFSINQEGRPHNITVIESPSDAFSREAIRLLEEGPAWDPASMNDVPLPGPVRLSIEFVKED